MAKGKGGFPGMGGGANMQQMLRQAQKMQQDIQRTQEELEQREFSASVGGGVVTAVVFGNKTLKSITIEPSCIDPEDPEMLQDLVLSAVNEALRVADETVSGEMAKITGGMNLGL